MGRPLSDVAIGVYDAEIFTWFEQAAAWGHNFILRFNHEMNGNWFDWGTQSGNTYNNTPADFVAAWQHVHDLARLANAANVSWLWCPNIDGTGQPSFASLYPGTDYVDRTGLDGYNKTQPGFTRTFTQIYGASYDLLLAVAPDKSITIGEVSSREIFTDKAQWITDMLLREIPNDFPMVDSVLWFNWKIAKTYVPGFGDEFTDAPDIALSTHTFPHGVIDGSSLTWASGGAGGLSISNQNRVRADSATIGLYVASAAPMGTDYKVQCDLKRIDLSGGQISGVVLRYDQTTDTGYIFRWNDNGNWEILKRVAGSNTTVATSSSPGFPVGTTHTLRAEVSGTSPTQLEMYVNDTHRGSFTDASSPITTAGNAGLRMVVGSNLSGVHIDNFVVLDAVSYDPWHIESSASAQAAFAAAIGTLLADPPTQQATRAVAAPFTWEANTVALYEHLAKLVADNR